MPWVPKIIALHNDTNVYLWVIINSVVAHVMTLSHWCICDSQNQKLLSSLLEVIAQPYKYFKYANVSHSMFPESFIKLLRRKVMAFFGLWCCTLGGPMRWKLSGDALCGCGLWLCPRRTVPQLRCAADWICSVPSVFLDTCDICSSGLHQNASRELCSKCC